MPKSTSKKMLELYQFEECPYCQRVRKKMTDLGLSYIIHNVPREREKRVELKKKFGQLFVPVLVDPNTNTVIVDDDDAILKYLEDNYSNN
jgi:glutathione S-transferase